jgi:hypothetical protein
MPSGYYDLYAEAGSLFVIKLNFLDSNGETAKLHAAPYYIPEELKAIGWTTVNSITAVLQVKKKPTSGGTGSALIAFSSLPGTTTAGKINFVDASLNADGTPKSDHNILIYVPTIEGIETGTHFYDLELTFNGGSGGTPSDIKLRILQGRFTITPQVTS